MCFMLIFRVVFNLDYNVLNELLTRGNETTDLRHKITRTHSYTVKGTATAVPSTE